MSHNVHMKFNQEEGAYSMSLAHIKERKEFESSQLLSLSGHLLLSLSLSV